MQSKEAPVSRFPFLTFAIFVLVVSVIAAAVAVSAGIGHRLQWWSVRTALQILRVGFFGSFFSLFPAIVITYFTWRGKFVKCLGISLIALLLSLLVTASGFVWWDAVKRVPPIHDITTDTSNPPSFSILLDARRRAPNSSAYGGAEVAEQQKKAYPDILPLILPMPTDKAFNKARSVLQGMGLEIAGENAVEARIEATDTTFWFGFKDDVVIRILPEEKGSRIDIRSVSRVGKGDVGTNANRIRKFIRWMQE